MNIDDRGKRAADDLAARAAGANVPPPPGPSTHRLRPVWAFAAGAAVVIALVLVPLVLLGGPRDDEPAVTTQPPPTAGTTAPPITVVQPDPSSETSTPPTTGSTGLTVTTQIESLAGELESAPGASTTATFGWGSGVGNLGLNEKNVGPCCFDVTHDGTVVVLDTAKLRLVATDPRVGPRTIAEWEATDFVPDAMAIAREPGDDVIFVLGMTNRPQRPHDLISMKLDGTVIERAETIVDINVEMIESAGSVWAASRRASGVGWIPLATEVGDIFDLEDQEIRDQLLLSDGTTMEIEYTPQATGMVLTHTNRLGATRRTRIDERNETWGHFARPFGPNHFLVTAATTEIDVDGTVGRLAAVIDRTGVVVDGFTWTGSEWGEIGPFGLIRVGSDGAVYSMSSMESGTVIQRRALAAAGAFDALAARVAGGGAMHISDRTLWIAGGYQSDQSGEWGEILQVDLTTSTVEEVYRVSGPMNALAVADGVLYAARAGDGGLPTNTLVRIDLRSDLVDEIDLGELSTVDAAATSEGVWLLTWNGGEGFPADLAFVRLDGSAIERTVRLPSGAKPTAMHRFRNVVWIATLDGPVLRYDLNADVFLPAYDSGIAGGDILVEADRFDSDLSIWIGGIDGGIVKLRADGTIVAAHEVEGRIAAVTGDASMGNVWAVTDDGRLLYVDELGVSVVAVGDVRDVTDLAFDGRHWILGSTLEVVSRGQ